MIDEIDDVVLGILKTIGALFLLIMFPLYIIPYLIWRRGYYGSLLR